MRVDPGSTQDPAGFVFHHEDGVYRAVSPSAEGSVRELERQGVYRDLIDSKELVPTSFVDPASALFRALSTRFPAYPCFLKHERIGLITYPYEWTYHMLSDAALFVLRLQGRLLERGLTLKDATAYNVQFLNGRPVWIDVLSIEKSVRPDIWYAYGQFCRHFLYPLLLKDRFGYSAKGLFLANRDGISLSDVRALLGFWRSWSPSSILDVGLPSWLGRLDRDGTWEKKLVSSSRPLQEADVSFQRKNLRRLEEKVGRWAGSGTAGSGGWLDYPSECPYSPRSAGHKKEIIRRYLAESKPRRVVDLGCNTGDYTRLASEGDASVVALDGDHACVDRLHLRLRESPGPVTLVWTDLTNPSPALGLNNRERASLMERVRGDLVLALALMHHLLSQGMGLPQIYELLKTMSDRFLAVEYVPPDDPERRRMASLRTEPEEASERDRFLSLFRTGYDLLREDPIDGSTRTLFLFEKKKE
ncbi:MAG TPA: class I SAM-dependent methyltransferase [Elusimicrobiota bacterium]|nr:class I SAM-dependent methyltransferase [Elusimicrobiota bacterium]